MDWVVATQYLILSTRVEEENSQKSAFVYRTSMNTVTVPWTIDSQCAYLLLFLTIYFIVHNQTKSHSYWLSCLVFNMYDWQQFCNVHYIILNIIFITIAIHFLTTSNWIKSTHYPLNGLLKNTSVLLKCNHGAVILILKGRLSLSMH